MADSLNMQVVALNASLRADVLLVPVLTPKGKAKAPALTGLKGATAARLKELLGVYAAGDGVGSVDATTVGTGASIARVAVVSIGGEKHPSGNDLRMAAAKAYKWCAAHSFKKVAVAVDALKQAAGASALGAWAEGSSMAAFRYEKMKSKPGKNSVVQLLFATASKSKSLSADVKRAQALCDGVNLTRELGHEPPNVINPVTLAQRVQKLAKKAGLKCTVLDDKKIRALKMGALWAVGKGSATKPRLIILEHKGKKSGGKPVVLVGKAITLDSGGYSLKPAASIPQMKYDKQGGMTVIGAMMAAAALKLKQRVIGVIPSAENMIDGDAYRPGDIITAMNGKTIEVDNTDAEGRLILADALHYAEKNFKPSAMIDLATLTGAIGVALGDHCAGLFTPDDKMAAKVQLAADATGERVWRLPLWKAYREQIKGADADIKNTGGRKAGSITAALFLKEFVTDKTPWAHLDIAYAGIADSASPLYPAGATGWGVRLLIDFVEQNG